MSIIEELTAAARAAKSAATKARNAATKADDAVRASAADAEGLVELVAARDVAEALAIEAEATRDAAERERAQEALRLAEEASAAEEAARVAEAATEAARVAESARLDALDERAGKIALLAELRAQADALAGELESPAPVDAGATSTPAAVVAEAIPAVVVEAGAAHVYPRPVEPGDYNPMPGERTGFIQARADPVASARVHIAVPAGAQYARDGTIRALAAPASAVVPVTAQLPRIAGVAGVPTEAIAEAPGTVAPSSSSVPAVAGAPQVMRTADGSIIAAPPGAASPGMRDQLVPIVAAGQAARMQLQRIALALPADDPRRAEALAQAQRAGDALSAAASALVS